MIKAFIFDLDGVLIDTEKLFFIFWRKAAEDCGYAMTEEQALSLRSLAGKFAEVKFKEWFGEKGDYKKCRSRRMEYMNAYIDEHGLEKKKGAAELLAYLRDKKYKISLATATDLTRASKYLEMTGLIDYFDILTSAHMVQNGKPYPDIYIKAVNDLGLKAEECVAVEDSPNGVTSAYRAGCKVIMVPDLTEPDAILCGMLYKKCASLDKIPEELFGETIRSRI